MYSPSEVVLSLFVVTSQEVIHVMVEVWYIYSSNRERRNALEFSLLEFLLRPRTKRLNMTACTRGHIHLVVLVHGLWGKSVAPNYAFACVACSVRPSGNVRHLGVAREELQRAHERMLEHGHTESWPDNQPGTRILVA